MGELILVRDIMRSQFGEKGVLDACDPVYLHLGFFRSRVSYGGKRHLEGDNDPS